MDRSGSEPGSAGAGGAPDVPNAMAESPPQQPEQAGQDADSDLEFQASSGSGSEWEAQSGDSGGEWGPLPDPNDQQQLADFLQAGPEPDQLAALHQVMADNGQAHVLHAALMEHAWGEGALDEHDLAEWAEDFDEEEADSQDDSEGEDDESNPDLPPEASFCPPGWADGPGAAGGWLAGRREWQEVVSGTSHSQAADALCAWRSPAGHWELAVARPRRLQLWRAQGEGAAAPELLAELQFLMYPFSLARSADGAAFAIGGDGGLVLIVTCCTERPAGERLRIAAVLHLGPPQMPGDNNMINGLRFATLCGKPCLLAAAQDGVLYVLANPHTPQSVQRGEAATVGRYLLPMMPGWPMEQDAQRREAADRWDPLPAMWPVEGETYQYSAGGVLEVSDRSDGAMGTALMREIAPPLNQAVPSPCGRWVALAQDTREVWVLDAAVGLQRAHRLRVQRACGPAWAAPVGQETGAQYCAWSPDSRYLAASFDQLHCVRVWGAPGFQPLLSLESTKWPPLALAFSPARPSLLAVAARREHVYLLDVAAEVRCQAAASQQAREAGKQGGGASEAPATLQCLSTVDPAVEPPRTDGLALTDTSLLLATSKGLVEHSFLPPWSLGSHRLYPARLKAAARALLMCASKGPTAMADGAASVGDLPGIAVLKVIAALAAEYPVYFPPCGQLPTLTLH